MDYSVYNGFKLSDVAVSKKTPHRIGRLHEPDTVALTGYPLQALSFSVFLSISLCLTLSLTFTHSLFQSVCVSLSLYTSLISCPSLSVYLTLFFFLSLCLSIIIIIIMKIIYIAPNPLKALGALQNQ